MKVSKQECAKPPKVPKPNMKNKVFVKWSRAESCRKDDNIVSTDWHETLKRTAPFQPAYKDKHFHKDEMKEKSGLGKISRKAPLNMVYLLSGEYGRIWQKERDEWFSNVFVPKAREKDMWERRKKIRQQIKEAKKAAEIGIKERKERRAKEIEAKAKAEAEKLEKLKAKVRKLAAAKTSGKIQKKAKETKPKSAVQTSEQNEEICPKGWTPVELTLQCECSDHDKEKNDSEEKKKDENEPETSRTQGSDQGCVMCEGYIQQLKDIQNEKCNTTEFNSENSNKQETEKEMAAK